MALTAALLTGLSGLVANQTEINVAGNNIANANTTAFKASTALFSPQFYLTTSAGTPANSTFGGTNPSQIGLGAQVASIQQNLTQGELQTTGVPTDLAIDGAGYFQVSDPDGTNAAYTRDGAFTINSNNQLVNTAGQVVNGFTVDSGFNLLNSGNATEITIPPKNLVTVATATGTASLAGTLNPGGVVGTTGDVWQSQALEITGGGTFSGTSTLVNLSTVGSSSPAFTANQTFTLTPTLGGSTKLPTQSFVVTNTATVAQFETFLTGGYGIDPSPTTGVTPAGGTFPPDPSGTGQDLVITGNVGTVNTIDLSSTALTLAGNVASPISFTKEVSANGESQSTPVTVYDSDGGAVTVNVNSVLVGESGVGATPGSTWNYYVTSPDNSLSTGDPPLLNTSGTVATLQFNTSGQIIGGNTGTISIGRATSSALSPLTVTLDFNGVEAISGANSTPVTEASQDGVPKGTFNSFSIGNDGTISATYSNGSTKTIGQVLLYTFDNPNGLVNQGNNEYTPGASSGVAIQQTPANGAAGSINAGQLELSNVDLSTEFINLIIASTGYSASSKVITTSDQLLTDLLNSQR